MPNAIRGAAEEADSEAMVVESLQAYFDSAEVQLGLGGMCSFFSENKPATLPTEALASSSMVLNMRR